MDGSPCSEDTVMKNQYTTLGICGYHIEWFPFYRWKHIWPSWDSQHSEFLTAELQINSLTPILLSYPLKCTAQSEFVLKILPIFFISVSSWSVSVILQPGTCPLRLTSILNSSLLLLDFVLYLPGMGSNLLKYIEKDLSPWKYNL